MRRWTGTSLNQLRTRKTPLTTGLSLKNSPGLAPSLPILPVNKLLPTDTHYPPILSWKRYTLWLSVLFLMNILCILVAMFFAIFICNNKAENSLKSTYHMVSYMVSYRIVSYSILSYPILSYPILSYTILCIISHFASHRISHRIASHRMASHRSITSHHDKISYRIYHCGSVWWHVIYSMYYVCTRSNKVFVSCILCHIIKYHNLICINPLTCDWCSLADMILLIHDISKLDRFQALKTEMKWKFSYTCVFVCVSIYINTNLLCRPKQFGISIWHYCVDIRCWWARLAVDQIPGSSYTKTH